MPRSTASRHPKPQPASTEPFADALAIISPDPGAITVAPAKPRAALHSGGDLEVESGADVTTSISTDASLRVGADARLRSDVRAGMGATVGERARIDGTIEVNGRLCWGAESLASSSVRVDGAFVTSDGLTRATCLRVRHGILPGGAEGGA